MKRAELEELFREFPGAADSIDDQILMDGKFKVEGGKAWMNDGFGWLFWDGDRTGGRTGWRWR